MLPAIITCARVRVRSCSFGCCDVSAVLTHDAPVSCHIQHWDRARAVRAGRSTGPSARYVQASGFVGLGLGLGPWALNVGWSECVGPHRHRRSVGYVEYAPGRQRTLITAAAAMRGRAPCGAASVETWPWPMGTRTRKHVCARDIKRGRPEMGILRPFGGVTGVRLRWEVGLCRKDCMREPVRRPAEGGGPGHEGRESSAGVWPCDREVRLKLAIRANAADGAVERRLCGGCALFAYTEGAPEFCFAHSLVLLTRCRYAAGSAGMDACRAGVQVHCSRWPMGGL